MSHTNDYTLDNNASEISSAIESLSDCYNEHKDDWNYGAFWGKVEDINEMFENLELREGDRQELWSDLGDYCDRVKNAMEEQDKQRSKNAKKIRRKIDRLSRNYNSFKREWNYNSFWEDVEKINEMFSDLDLKDGDREELWSELQDYCDRVKSAMDKNADDIRKAINRLSEHYSNLSGDWDYSSFWEDVDKINEMFSDLELKDEDREELWSELQDYCDRVKSAMEKEESKKDRQSMRRRKLVLDKLDAVSSMLSEADNVEDWREAKSALYKIQEWMKSGWDAADIHIQLLKDLVGNEGHFSDEDWRRCQDKWNEVRDKVENKYEKICKMNTKRFRKNYLEDIANESAYGDPFEATEKIKKAQKELHSGKAFKDHQFDTLKSKLQKYWKRAEKRIKDKKRERKMEWKEDMKDHIRRWKNTIKKHQRFIDKKEREISELERELNNAKSKEHEKRVSNWIDKKRKKIREASDDISEMEDKISDVKRKIRD